MNKQQLEQLVTGMLFAVLIVPLFVVCNPITDHFLATYFSQALFFQLLVEILFVAWLTLAITNKSYRPTWRHPIVIGVSVFMLLLILSQFFSVDFERSFWSVQDRMTGLFHYLHLWALFVVVHSFLKNKQELWVRLVRFSMIVSLIVAGIAIIESFTIYGDRITSTLSNPNHLAIYLLIHIFLGIWLCIESKQKWYLTIPALHLIVLWISGSRAGLLALAITIIPAILIYKQQTKWLLRFLIAITACTLIVLTFGRTIVQTLPTSLSEPINEIAGERLELWSIGWDVVLQRPFAGWGIDNFTVPFDQLRDPRIHTALNENWYDRAHNQLLDLVIATGLFGLIGYFVLWGVVFTQLVKKKTKELKIILLLLFATLIYLFFQFDIFYSNILLFIILAQIASTTPPSTLSQKKKSKHKLILILLLIAIIPILYLGNIRPFTKNLQKIRGIELLEQSVPLALSEFEESLSVTTHYEYNFRRQIASWVFADSKMFLTSKSDEAYELLSFLGDELGESMQKEPVELRMAMAAFGVQHALEQFDQEETGLAESYANTMRLIAPYRSEPFASLAIVYETRGDLMQAIEYYEQAKIFAFNNSWRTTFTILLASIYAKQGAWYSVTTEISELTSVKPTALVTLINAMSEGVEDNPDITDDLVDLTILAVNNQSTNLSLLESALKIFKAAERTEEAAAVQTLINRIQL